MITINDMSPLFRDPEISNMPENCIWADANNPGRSIQVVADIFRQPEILEMISSIYSKLTDQVFTNLNAFVLFLLEAFKWKCLNAGPQKPFGVTFPSQWHPNYNFIGFFRVIFENLYSYYTNPPPTPENTVYVADSNALYQMQENTSILVNDLYEPSTDLERSEKQWYDLYPLASLSNIFLELYQADSLSSRDCLLGVMVTHPISILSLEPSVMMQMAQELPLSKVNLFHLLQEDDLQHLHGVEFNRATERMSKLSWAFYGRGYMSLDQYQCSDRYANDKNAISHAQSRLMHRGMGVMLVLMSMHPSKIWDDEDWLDLKNQIIRTLDLCKTQVTEYTNQIQRFTDPILKQEGLEKLIILIFGSKRLRSWKQLLNKLSDAFMQFESYWLQQHPLKSV